MEDSLGLTRKRSATSRGAVVLILVVMEDSLGPVYTCSSMTTRRTVLILVVMEDSLGLYGNRKDNMVKLCLNPCCNGR